MNKIQKAARARLSVPGHERIPVSTQENISIGKKVEEYSDKPAPPGMSFGVVLKVAYKNDKVMGWIRICAKKRKADLFFSQYWSGSRWIHAFSKLDVVCTHVEKGHVEAQVYPLSFFKPEGAGEVAGLEYGVVTAIQAGDDGQCFGRVLARYGFNIDEYLFKFLPLGLSADAVQPGTSVCFNSHQLPNGQLQARKMRPLGVGDSELQVKAVRSKCGVMAKRQALWCGMVLSIHPAGGQYEGEVGIILFEDPVTCAIGGFGAGVSAAEIKAGDIVEFEHEVGRAGRYYALNVRPRKVEESQKASLSE